MAYSVVPIACRETGYASVSLREHRWQAGDVAERLGDRHLLAWRIFPVNLGLRAADRPLESRIGRLSFHPAHGVTRTSGASCDGWAHSIDYQFDPSWFSSICASQPAASEHCPARMLEIENSLINQLISRLGQEILRSKPDSIFMDALCTCLAVEMARYFQEARPVKFRTHNCRLDQRDLQEIIGYIENNICNQNICLSTSTLARTFSISPTHLRRAFKASTGQTLQSFVADIRLNKAKALLEGSDSIKSIAFQLGYREASSLSSSFKLAFGQTASEFRHSIK